MMGSRLQIDNFPTQWHAYTRPPYHRRSRNGTATVEFAVVLPVIVFILLAFLEIASSVNLKSALQNASREGARHAIVPSATSASVTEACLASLNANGVKGAEISVSPDLKSAKSGSLIQVTVSAIAAENAWILKGKLMGNRLVISTTSMRKE